MSTLKYPRKSVLKKDLQLAFWSERGGVSMDPRGEIVGVDISANRRVSALLRVVALCLHSSTHSGQDRVGDAEVSVRAPRGSQLRPWSSGAHLGLDSPPPPLAETLHPGWAKSAPGDSDKGRHR